MKADHTQVTRLLKTARGQIDGILKMVEEDRYCLEVSSQIMAAQSILKKANRMVLKAHMDCCVREAVASGAPDEKLEELAALVQRQGAQELVMGYPRNMDGTLGPRAEKYAAFARRLEEATGLPVALWDERRTTVDAHRILGEQGVRAKNRKDKIDSVAATLILEGYLDWKRLQAQRQEREEETP